MVRSAVHSFLDIGASLEHLWTLGMPVIGYCTGWPGHEPAERMGEARTSLETPASHGTT